METTDLRPLSREARHERRVQVIRLREAGQTYDAIAVQTGLSRTGVLDICRRYARDGATALHDAIGGRQVGEGRSLSLEQEQEIRQRICSGSPFGWRCARGDGICRAGASRRKTAAPGLRAIAGGRPTKRLAHDSPIIAARARFGGADIHWGEETGRRSDDVHGRSCAPKGKTPVVRVSNKRRSLSVISSVTSKGPMRWKMFEGAANADILLDFMGRLIKDAPKKIFLILDNLRAPHSKPSPRKRQRVPGCNWSRQRHGICAACRKDPNAFAATLNMRRFALLPDSNL